MSSRPWRFVSVAVACALVFLLVLSLALPALAADPPPPTDPVPSAALAGALSLSSPFSAPVFPAESWWWGQVLGRQRGRPVGRRQHDKPAHAGGRGRPGQWHAGHRCR